MSDTPKWALDLVMVIQRWEDEGHQLTRESNMAEVRAACHKDWLQLVPEDVRKAAAAIRDYVGDPAAPPVEPCAGS